MNPTPLTRSKLLFCEGKDEEQFFGALFKHLGRTDVQIAPVGGKHGFQKGFAAVVNDPNFPQVSDILIVRDADCAAFAPTCGASLRHEPGNAFAFFWEGAAAPLHMFGRRDRSHHAPRDDR